MIPTTGPVSFAMLRDELQVTNAEANFYTLNLYRYDCRMPSPVYNLNGWRGYIHAPCYYTPGYFSLFTNAFPQNTQGFSTCADALASTPGYDWGASPFYLDTASVQVGSKILALGQNGYYYPVMYSGWYKIGSNTVYITAGTLGSALNSNTTLLPPDNVGNVTFYQSSDGATITEIRSVCVEGPYTVYVSNVDKTDLCLFATSVTVYIGTPGYTATGTQIYASDSVTPLTGYTQIALNSSVWSIGYGTGIIGSDEGAC